MEVIGGETGCTYVTDDGRQLPVRELGRDFDKFWFKEVHSGSSAIEAARQILAHPGSLHTGEFSEEILYICSELIYRVTGEQVTPQGFFWLGDGEELHCSVCHIEFVDDGK